MTMLESLANETTTDAVVLRAVERAIAELRRGEVGDAEDRRSRVLGADPLMLFIVSKLFGVHGASALAL